MSRSNSSNVTEILLDMNLLGRIIEQGLVKTGRLARLRVTVPDVPGQLAKACTVIAECRANIREIEHERGMVGFSNTMMIELWFSAFLLADVQYTQPIITVETRGPDHVEELVSRLRGAGFDKVALDTSHE